MIPNRLPGRILLIDDSALQREFAAELCQRMGIEQILHAADGFEAINLLRDDANIEAIILDLEMPGMDGLETLRHMKEKAPNLPVILLTGHACMGVAVQGLDLGAYDYMLKPVAISELIIKMEEAARSAM